MSLISKTFKNLANFTVMLMLLKFMYGTMSSVRGSQSRSKNSRSPRKYLKLRRDAVKIIQRAGRGVIKPKGKLHKSGGEFRQQGSLMSVSGLGRMRAE